MTEAATKQAADSSSIEFRSGLIKLLPHLRAFARGLCGRADRADDLVQEAVLRAWSAKDLFVPGTNLKAWLFTIARNHFLNDLRKSHRETQLEEGQAEVMLVSKAEQEDGLNLSDLQRALDRLPPERREALLLVGASGFSYEEAAQGMRRGGGDDEEQDRKGRAQLAQILENERDAGPSPS